MLFQSQKELNGSNVPRLAYLFFLHEGQLTGSGRSEIMGHRQEYAHCCHSYWCTVSTGQWLTGHYRYLLASPMTTNMDMGHHPSDKIVVVYML